MSAGKDQADFYDQIPIVLRELLYRFNDDNSVVLKGNYDAFSALSTHVPAEELVKHVEFIRNLISSMVSDARRRKGGVGDGEFLMPGFNIPKGKLKYPTVIHFDALNMMISFVIHIPKRNLGDFD